MTTDAERLTAGFVPTLAKAPFGVAPEAAADLAQLPASDWELLFREGRANFKILIDTKQIAIHFSGLLSLWAVARAALIISNAGMKMSRAPEDSANADIGPHVGEAIELLKGAEQIIRDYKASWPENLPKPNPAALEGTQDWFDNNLFLAAFGWAMLHEMAHIQLEHEDATTDALLKQQEHAADEWATHWILDRVTDDKIREFRVLVTGVGIAWVGLLDKVKRASATHPHAAERLSRCQQHFGVQALSPSLEALSYVVKAFFDPLSAVPPSDTPEEAFFDAVRRYVRAER